MKFYRRSPLQGPRGSQTHPMVISLVPGCLRGADTLSSRQSPRIGPRTCGVSAIVVEMVQRKPPELPLSRQRENQKPNHIPGGVAEISATTQASKGGGGRAGDRPADPFDCPVLAWAEDGLDTDLASRDFNQAVTPVGAAVPEVISRPG